MRGISRSLKESQKSIRALTILGTFGAVLSMPRGSNVLWCLCSLHTHDSHTRMTTLCFHPPHLGFKAVSPIGTLITSGVGTMAYKGMMFSDVPNLASAFGYTNASWTLKCDLTAEYVCRLLKHMDQHGYAQCTPRVNDPELTEEPVLDFPSGYLLRALHTLPRQGSRRVSHEAQMLFHR